MTLSRIVRNHGLQLKEDLHEYFVPFVASDTFVGRQSYRTVAAGRDQGGGAVLHQAIPVRDAGMDAMAGRRQPDYSGKWLVVGHDLARGGAWRPKPAESAGGLAAETNFEELLALDGLAQF